MLIPGTKVTVAYGYGEIVDFDKNDYGVFVPSITAFPSPRFKLEEIYVKDEIAQAWEILICGKKSFGLE